MFAPDQYQLLDFGDGRRLERFAGVTLDRPCPAAERIAPADQAAWRQADARFDRTDSERGEWTCRRELPERWTIAGGPLVLELKRTQFGHLGVFPEQGDNWRWIAEQVRLAGQSRPVGRSALRVLNLFAYTGGSTLAAAAAGAEVVHVDAAKNIVAWARRNAALSGLADAPIHWIVDDAMKFVKRELRRGSLYDAVILDPPSYGHGARGEVWRLSKHLPRLLDLCRGLTAGRLRFILLTCHTPDFEPSRLAGMMARALDPSPAGRRRSLAAASLSLPSATGRTLPSGSVVKWSA